MVHLDAESLAIVRHDARITFVPKHIELRSIWQAHAIRTSNIVKVYEHMWMVFSVLQLSNFCGLRAPPIPTQAQMRVKQNKKNRHAKHYHNEFLKLW